MTYRINEFSMCRKQTTKGIWIAKCITPRIIIMDVEGYEGKEREEVAIYVPYRHLLFNSSTIITCGLYYHYHLFPGRNEKKKHTHNHW